MYNRLPKRVSDSSHAIHFPQCRTSRLPVVRKELPASPDCLSLREASVAGLPLPPLPLHRHIFSLYHQVAVETQPFLVIQRALGGDLYDLITLAPQGRLALSDAKRIFAQLILALEHMHQNHIVHAYVYVSDLVRTSRARNSSAATCDGCRQNGAVYIPCVRNSPLFILVLPAGWMDGWLPQRCEAR